MSDRFSNSSFSRLKEIAIYVDWFKAYQITPDLFVFQEPYHFEETLSYLIIGKEKAILIDTACGIGNLKKVVEEITDKPIMVINTHSHLDHIGGNYQFDEISMFDHAISRQISKEGVSHEIILKEILADNLITKPLPEHFDPKGFYLPPFRVEHWLNDGNRMTLDEKELLVIHTPGEAVDHVCLLDRTDRILFCGDILLNGPVWTHLEGGSINDLIKSYYKLMKYYDDFDYLMPGHNETMLDKRLLPYAIKAAEKVTSGDADYTEEIDPWNRKLKRYSFGPFSILTQNDDNFSI